MLLSGAEKLKGLIEQLLLEKDDFGDNARSELQGFFDEPPNLWSIPD
jgi:hypothetical protein